MSEVKSSARNWACFFGYHSPRISASPVPHWTVTSCKHCESRMLVNGRGERHNDPADIKGLIPLLGWRWASLPLFRGNDASS